MKAIRILLGIVAFVIAYYGVRALVQPGRGRGGTYERAFDRAVRAQGGYDDFKSFARATSDRREIQRRTVTLTRRGLTLLSMEDKAARVEIIDRFLTTAPVGICATFYRGTGGRDVIQSLIESLDSASLDRFATMAARAFIAAMRDSTYRPRALSPNELADFIAAVGAGLDRTDKVRFQNVLSTFQTASDNEVCWLGRAVYLHVLAQEGASRTRALDMITLIEAQEPR